MFLPILGEAYKSNKLLQWICLSAKRLVLSPAAIALIATSIPFLLVKLVALFMPYFALILLIILLFLTVGLVILLGIHGAKKIKQDEIKKYGFTLEAARTFYQECLKLNIKNLNTPANKERALLLAKSNSLFNKIENIDKVYSDMFYFVQKKENEKRIAEQEKELQKIRDLEQEQVAYNTRIANLYGREKKIFLLNEQLNNINTSIKNLENVRNGSSALLSSSLEKERGWGMTGGIATGIGGPVAGIAAISDIASKNADIRARNANIYAAFSPMVESLYLQLANLEREAERLEEEIKKTSIKLIKQDFTIERLFNQLVFNDINSSFSMTGAMTVTANVVPKQSLVIDGVKYTIDGTVIAEVYQNDTKIGEAYLNLPLNGVYKDDISLQGICIATQKEQQYTIKIIPKSLWLIEL